MLNAVSTAARILSVAFCLAAVAGCGGAEARRAKAISRGEEFLAAGNLEKARVEFRNALQISPNDPVARYENARVLERLGKYGEAIQYYNGAIDVQPDYVAARTDYARMLVLFGGAQRAAEVLDAGLKKHPGDAQMLALRATARIQLKDRIGAMADAELAYQNDPDSETTASVLAGLSASGGNPDRAADLLSGSLKKHPDSTDLRLALAQLELTRHQPAKAESLLRDVVRLKPDDRESWLRLARFLVAQKQVDDAERVIRDGIAALPKDRPLKFALVEFLAANRGREQAEQMLRRMVADAEHDDFVPKFALGQFYVAGGEQAKAEALYGEVIAQERTRTAGLGARDKLAALRVQQGRPADAEKLVAEVLAVNPRDSEALAIRGNLLLAKGDTSGAISDLRAVLRDQPAAVGVARVLARAYERNGEQELALETLRAVAESNPKDAPLAMEFAGLLLDLGKAPDALPIAERIAKDLPADFDAQSLLFKVQAMLKDYPAAQQVAVTIGGLPGREAAGHTLLGMLAEEQHQDGAAVAEYERALTASPSAEEPLSGLTRLLVSKGRSAEALQRLDKVAAQVPTDALPLALKGEILTGEKRFADAEAALSAARDRAPRWWLPYRTRAHLEIARGNVPRAIQVLEDSVATVDDPNRLRAVLADLYEAQGRSDEAVKQYEAMLALAPGDAVASNNLAMMLVTTRHDAASLARAASLTERFSNSSNAAMLDTFGWVRTVRGDAKSALPALEKAQMLAPSSGVISYHLGKAALAAGQADRAAAALRKALDADAGAPWANDARDALAKVTRRG